MLSSHINKSAAAKQCLFNLSPFSKKKKIRRREPLNLLRHFLENKGTANARWSNEHVCVMIHMKAHFHAYSAGARGIASGFVKKPFSKCIFKSKKNVLRRILEGVQ